MDICCTSPGFAIASEADKLETSQYLKSGIELFLLHISGIKAHI